MNQKEDSYHEAEILCERARFHGPSDTPIENLKKDVDTKKLHYKTLRRFFEIYKQTNCTTL